jgi:NTE family protein
VILNFSNDLERNISEAESYEEWVAAAQRYDSKYKLDRWKNIDQSRRYDYVSIRTRLDRLRAYRARHDDHGLLFALNEGIHGNMGGMGGVELYKKSRFGTKNLINDYVDEVVSALEYLASDKVTDISLEEKLEFFQRASHCYGRSALLLSGAGTLLHFHLGVVKALWQQNLLPKIIAGSSGGAFVAAMVGTHSRDELEKLFDPDFMDLEAEKEVGILRHFTAFRSKQIAVGEFHMLMERLLPEITFQEAYELTGIQINISVAPAEEHQTSRLLNAITSPNVLVREAVTASCAVPGIYPPVGLAAKNVKGEKQAYLPSRKWVDGSLTEDLPIKRLSRLYGVNHTVVSQTNPLVLPFINENKNNKGWAAILKTASFNTFREWTLAGTKMLQHPAAKQFKINTLLNAYSSIISQTYTGDINILPTRRINNLLRAVSPRSKEEIVSLIKDGERSAWPQLERVRIQTRISTSLNSVLQNFEHNIVVKAEELEHEHESNDVQSA